MRVSTQDFVTNRLQTAFNGEMSNLENNTLHRIYKKLHLGALKAFADEKARIAYPIIMIQSL
jgi:hypothetical protein